MQPSGRPNRPGEGDGARGGGEGTGGEMGAEEEDA